MPGAPEIPVPSTLPQPTVQSPELLPQPTAPVRIGNGSEAVWVSSRRWAGDRGLPEPRSVSTTPALTQAIATGKGEFIFQAGSLSAYWDGIEVRLGFAPQLVGSDVFLHVLDVRKTLESLMRGALLPSASNRLIVIDPGHGGKNLGTRSVADGRVEKEFTLDWALRLAPLLEQRGWRVLLTRTNDVDVSLAERVAFAEDNRADFFLSLHFNASGNGSREPAGLETYVTTPVGMPSSLTRGYRDDTLQTLPGNASDAENIAYAMRLHRALLTVNGNNDRGVRHARFLDVLRGQRQPAVLVEGGYLSNPHEAQLIGLPAYRQRLAEAVAKALE